MIAGMTYYEICWYFLIYSFAGWVVEVVFHAIKLGKIINRGFLNGPVCPVYGFGILGIMALINSMKAYGKGTSDIGIIPMFLLGIVVATLIELIAGWLLDILFHARWWDYSDQKFNFKGYICLKFSLIWGAAIVLVLRIIHPAMGVKTTQLIPEKYGWIFLAAAYAGYLADLIVTVMIVRDMNKRLKELDQIRHSMRIVSDNLSELLATTSISAAQKVGEGQVQAALAKAELRDKTTEISENAQRKTREMKESMQQKTVEMVETAQQRTAEMVETAQQRTVEMVETAQQRTVGMVETAQQRTVEMVETAQQRTVDAVETAQLKTKESLQRRAEELQKKADELTARMTRTHSGSRRLMRAFPDMKSRDYMETLKELKEKLKR